VINRLRKALVYFFFVFFLGLLHGYNIGGVFRFAVVPAQRMGNSSVTVHLT
jgi:hypothetical protein